MSGVRPIEMIVSAALSEQAPTVILNNHFCMAELLHLFWYIAHNVHVKYGEVCYNKINVTIQNQCHLVKLIGSL